MEGGRGGREGAEVGERGGRDDCYTYFNIGMFNSNPIHHFYTSAMAISERGDTSF